MMNKWTPSAISCVLGAGFNYWMALNLFQQGKAFAALGSMIVGIIFTVLGTAIENQK